MAPSGASPGPSALLSQVLDEDDTEAINAFRVQKFLILQSLLEQEQAEASAAAADMNGKEDAGPAAVPAGPHGVDDVDQDDDQDDEDCEDEDASDIDPDASVVDGAPAEQQGMVGAAASLHDHLDNENDSTVLQVAVDSHLDCVEVPYSAPTGQDRDSASDHMAEHQSAIALKEVIINEAEGDDEDELSVATNRAANYLDLVEEANVETGVVGGDSATAEALGDEVEVEFDIDGYFEDPIGGEVEPKQEDLIDEVKSHEPPALLMGTSPAHVAPVRSARFVQPSPVSRRKSSLVLRRRYSAISLSHLLSDLELSISELEGSSQSEPRRPDLEQETTFSEILGGYRPPSTAPPHVLATNASTKSSMEEVLEVDENGDVRGQFNLVKKLDDGRIIKLKASRIMRRGNSPGPTTLRSFKVAEAGNDLPPSPPSDIVGLPNGGSAGVPVLSTPNLPVVNEVDDEFDQFVQAEAAAAEKRKKKKETNISEQILMQDGRVIKKLTITAPAKALKLMGLLDSASSKKKRVPDIGKGKEGDVEASKPVSKGSSNPETPIGATRLREVQSNENTVLGRKGWTGPTTPPSPPNTPIKESDAPAPRLWGLGRSSINYETKVPSEGLARSSTVKSKTSPSTNLRDVRPSEDGLKRQNSTPVKKVHLKPAPPLPAPVTGTIQSLGSSTKGPQQQKTAPLSSAAPPGAVSTAKKTSQVNAPRPSLDVRPETLRRAGGTVIGAFNTSESTAVARQSFDMPRPSFQADRKNSNSNIGPAARGERDVTVAALLSEDDRLGGTAQGGVGVVTGNLMKLSSNAFFKTWSRRFFVLSPMRGKLFYFRGPDSGDRVIGWISLNGRSQVSTASRVSYRNKPSILLTSEDQGGVGGVTWFMATENEIDRMRWIRGLQAAIEDAKVPKAGALESPNSALTHPVGPLAFSPSGILSAPVISTTPVPMEEAEMGKDRPFSFTPSERPLPYSPPDRPLAAAPDSSPMMQSNTLPPHNTYYHPTVPYFQGIPFVPPSSGGSLSESNRADSLSTSSNRPVSPVGYRPDISLLALENLHRQQQQIIATQQILLANAAAQAAAMQQQISPTSTSPTNKLNTSPMFNQHPQSFVPVPTRTVSSLPTQFTYLGGIQEPTLHHVQQIKRQHGTTGNTLPQQPQFGGPPLVPHPNPMLLMMMMNGGIAAPFPPFQSQAQHGQIPLPSKHQQQWPQPMSTSSLENNSLPRGTTSTVEASAFNGKAHPPVDTIAAAVTSGVNSSGDGTRTSSMTASREQQRLRDNAYPQQIMHPNLKIIKADDENIYTESVDDGSSDGDEGRLGSGRVEELRSGSQLWY